MHHLLSKTNASSHPYQHQLRCHHQNWKLNVLVLTSQHRNPPLQRFDFLNSAATEEEEWRSGGGGGKQGDEEAEGGAAVGREGN